MRFIRISDGSYVNAKTVNGFTAYNNGTVELYREDGSDMVVRTKNIPYAINNITGANHVVQVLPITAPIFAVWEQEDSTYYASEVGVLALCADGNIRAVSLEDGLFSVLGDETNYAGLYTESQLSGFKERGLEIGRHFERVFDWRNLCGESYADSAIKKPSSEKSGKSAADDIMERMNKYR